eukprot:TRINITY_DN6744_c0_g1_i1.p1 TRINITY_DN6744_c0_g1~~TRINITY_DN6744_c0_g1_i1.p1  ORF type:complete len:334 (+),score=37.41 TRINITY_DN6744_c0_g1_i1:47-1048(+)
MFATRVGGQFQRTSSAGPRSNTNIYIGSLLPGTTDHQITELFGQLGPISSVRVMAPKNGKVAALVSYTSPESAAHAVATMNGQLVGGVPIVCRHADHDPGHKKTLALQHGAGANDNVYVKGFPTDWTEAELNEVFGAYGTVVSSKVLRGKGNADTMGAGMVRFASPGEAAQVVQLTNGLELPGFGALAVRFATRGGEAAPTGLAMRTSRPPAAGFHPYARPAGTMAVTDLTSTQVGAELRATLPPVARPDPSSNVYIYGIPPTCNEHNLLECFAPYGAIYSVKVGRNKATGESKRYGFVHYMKQEDANAAIEALTGYPLQNPWHISLHAPKQR